MKKKMMISILLLLNIITITSAEWFTVVNIIWDHYGDGTYMVYMTITRDDGVIDNYQIGPIYKEWFRTDVDPHALHEVSITTVGGIPLYYTKFRIEDLPDMNEPAGSIFLNRGGMK